MQDKTEQPHEFQETVDYTRFLTPDPTIFELINILSQEETHYVTYSHT